MGKVGGLTVGIVAKPMEQVGWVLINKAGKPYAGRKIYTSYGIANRVRVDAEVDLEVKPVYIERVPES